MQEQKEAARLLLEAFQEMLQQIGETKLARLLPFELAQTPPDDLPPSQLSQFYSVAFQLMSIAEENQFAQQRRQRESQGQTLPGLWPQAFGEIKEQGIPFAELRELMGRIHVEPVLTAHPTESKRITILEYHRELFRLLKEMDNPRQSKAEQLELKSRMASVIERIWRTGELYAQKPTLQKEFKSILYYLSQVFPQVLDQLDQRLVWAWKEAGGPEDWLDDLAGFPRLSFGNWVGGDRDGHPLVTAEVTAKTLGELRCWALQLIWERLNQLGARLGLAEGRQKVPERLAQRRSELLLELGDDGRQAVAHNHEEPWREYLNLLLVKLPVREEGGRFTLDCRPYSYPSSVQLLADLDLLYKALQEIGARRIAQAELRGPYRLIKTFGFHLAALDIRQNSAYHDRAMAQILERVGVPEGGDYANWSEAKRLAFLNQELKSLRPFLLPSDSAGPEADALRETYGVVARHVEQYGVNAFGALIVSMTRDLSDLLAVYIFAREAGLLKPTEGGLACPLPVVPLLESINDLRAGPKILTAFLDHPITQASLDLIQTLKRRPNKVQQVMVGYSDSNKDGGILASQWNLYQAQRLMADVGLEREVLIRFFHGRGGSIGRGAGPTKSFLEALPPSSLMGSFRMTEQGETIAQKYGFRTTALYNLELLLAGVTLQSALNRQSHPLPADLTAAMEHLSAHSAEVYAQLVGDPEFPRFFEQATPIDLLEHSRIGSRPGRRTGKRSIGDLRAIPWVFSWNQSRFLLPSWYGAGSALKDLKESYPKLWEAFAAEPEDGHLGYLLQNIRRALALVDAEVMESYASLVAEADLRQRFMGRILDELERTRAMVDDLCGTECSLSLARFQRSIALRSGGLKHLHQQQVALLAAWRQAPERRDLLENLLMSVNAIASGLKNTG